MKEKKEQEEEETVPSADEGTATANEQDTKEKTDQQPVESGTGDGSPQPDDFYPVSASTTKTGTDDFYPVSEPTTKSRSDDEQTSEGPEDPT